MKNRDMPAMPMDNCFQWELENYSEQTKPVTGLTKREEFAKAAMQGILSGPMGKEIMEACDSSDAWESGMTEEIITMVALKYADKMLKGLEKDNETS